VKDKIKFSLYMKAPAQHTYVFSCSYNTNEKWYD